MADRNLQDDDEIIDLTELIESGKPSAAGYGDPGSAISDSDADFDAVLREAEEGDSHQRAAVAPVDPDEQLDMSAMNDIDNLLESLDIPEQPRAAAAPAKPAPPPPAEASAADLGFSDLDSVLDDLLGPAEGAGPRDHSRPAEELPGKTGASDDISLKAEVPPQDVESSQKSQDAMNVDADLDSILAEMEPPRPDAADVSPKKNTDEPANFDFAADLDAMLEETPESSPTPSDEFDLPPDLDALMDEPIEKAPPHEDLPPHMSMPQRAAAPSIAPVDAAEQTSAYPPEIVAGVCRNILGTQILGTQDALQDFARQLGAQTAHIEDLTRQVSDLGKRLIACETKLSSARARIATLEKNLDESASFEDILKDGTPLHTGFKSIIASAVSNALQGLPALAAGDENIRQQLAALQEAEASNSQKLELLAVKIQGLEQNATNSDLAEKVADLETDGAATAERIENLAEQVQRLDQRAQNARMEEKISALEIDGAASAERLNEVIPRVEVLENNLDEKMKKLAANAVARILHEEIARLMSGE